MNVAAVGTLNASVCWRSSCARVELLHHKLHRLAWLLEHRVLEGQYLYQRLSQKMSWW